ncbi:MAG: dTMP kinase [Pseudomonadota bacterium]
MTRGRFVTLEGIEGSGKSSLLQTLAAWLRTAHGLGVVTTREPGGTPLAEQLRRIVLAREGEPIPPNAELLIMFAARALHVTNVIAPALQRGDWVLCDRFTDASLAYQGYGRGMDLDEIRRLAHMAHPGLAPDLTLLLDLPSRTGLGRAQRRGAGDRFEDEALPFFDRVRDAYLQLAAAEPARFRVLDASLSVPGVLEQAQGALSGLLRPGAP